MRLGPAGVGGHLAEVLRPPGQDRPARLDAAADVAGVAVLDHARVAPVLGERGHHRLEAQVAVRDVEREDAARPQQVEVEAKRLAGEQVDRDRVGAERVHQDHVVALLRPVAPHRLHADARVAQLEPHGHPAVARVGRVGEVGRVEGDVAHHPVDLVEGDAIARPRVRREGAGAEPDHRHVHAARAPVQLREELADGALSLVVGEGLGAPGGLEALASVQRGAVAQLGVALGVAVARDAQHPEEGAALADLVVVARVHEARDQEHRGEGHAEVERAAPQEPRDREGRPVDQELVEQPLGRIEPLAHPLAAEVEHPGQEREVDTQGGRLRVEHRREQDRGRHREQRAPRPGAQPEPGAARRGEEHAGQHHHQRILDQRGEDERGHQGVEEPAQHAAHRDQQVELGEVERAGPVERQRPVAGERDDEEQTEVPEHDDPDALGQGGDHQEDHEEAEGQRERHHHVMEQPRPAAEGEDEGQQVDRERQHPEQRHRGQVGGDVGGDPEEQARRHEGEHDPVNSPRPPRAPLGRGRRALRLRDSGRGGGRGLPPEGQRAERDENGQRRVAQAPERGLGEPGRSLQVQVRLHQGGIAQEGQHAAQVAGRVEKVGIARGGVPGVGEPPLEQRGGGAHHQEGQAHRQREDREDVQHRVGLAAAQQARAHRERQDREGQRESDEVDEDLARGPDAGGEGVRVGVSAEERGLEEHHAGAPHRRGAAQEREDHLAHHRLHHEEKGGSREQGERVEQQDGGQTEDPPVAASGGGT